MKGNSDDNVIKGGAGDDIIEGGADGPNGDNLDGGGGVNTLSYAGSKDAVMVDLLNGAGNFGDADLDTFTNFQNLLGSVGDDVLYGDAGSNKIDGGAGNDSIEGGDGNDILIGGAGTQDTVTYGLATSGVTVSLAITTQQDTHGAGLDTLSGFEGIIGSDFADTLTGNSSANTIIGGDGDDIIDGGAGNDMLMGGSNTAIGDTVSYASATSAVTVNLALFTATGGGGKDSLNGFENITGSKFADILTGDSHDNHIIGGAGNDIIEGGAGADILDGGAGINTVSYANSASEVDVDLNLEGHGLLIRQPGRRIMATLRATC